MDFASQVPISQKNGQSQVGDGRQWRFPVSWGRHGL